MTVVGSYNHEEFVPEVSTGGDGRGGGEASCGMSEAGYVERCDVVNFESRRSH